MQSEIGWLKNDIFLLVLMVHQFVVFQLQISKKGITMMLISMMHYIIAYVATPLWPSVGVKPNTWKSCEFGILWDSRMFKAR
jgi:hypothetical protein